MSSKYTDRVVPWYSINNLIDYIMDSALSATWIIGGDLYQFLGYTYSNLQANDGCKMKVAHK